jgi:predicted DNA-binding antitoxin AbrB/MazE fold protein
MKKTLLVLLLASSSVFAKEVVVDGYGDTYESALKNAKVAAIEQVTGTWINAEHKLKDNKYSEDIVQYNGGVIKSYKVLSYDGNKIKIRADVDKVKNNIVDNIQSSSIDVNQRELLEQRRDNYRKIKESVESLNDASKALSFKPSKVDYLNHGEITRVVVRGNISWIPKWTSDVKSLVGEAGNPGTVENDIKQRVAGGVIHNLLMSNPIVAGVASIPATKISQSTRQNDSTPMICFTNKNNCNVIQRSMSNFQHKNSFRLEVTGRDFDHNIVQRTIEFDRNNLWQNIYAGTTETGNFNIRYTYRNDTLMINENAVMPVQFYFDVKTADLVKVDNFNYIIKGN